MSRVSPSTLERIVVVEGQASAAHGRLDRVEMTTRDELRGLNERLERVVKKVEHLVSMADKATGWLAAATFFGTVLGAILMKVVSKWIG